jgi:hypothetical protein
LSQEISRGDSLELSNPYAYSARLLLFACSWVSSDSASLLRTKAMISRSLGVFRRGRMSRSRLTTETCGRNCELAFERTVERSFGLITYFGCDLSH